MYKIEIPQGVTAEVKGPEITVKGSLGSNIRKFNDALLTVKREQNEIVVAPVKDKKLAGKSNNAARAMTTQIRNDINGVSKHFEVHMGIVFAHFPITVEIKGHEVHIKNIFGERVPRIADIVGETKVEVKDKNVRVYGISLDNVKQTAANIRIASKAHRKDERIFQDGVYYAIDE
jgi:large subunit ribosomal protein L6